MEVPMTDAPILAGINKVVDLEAAGDFEKKHTPFIDCVRNGDRLEVTVKVGHWVSHPNQPDHYIEWIEVHADGAPIARFDLSAVAVDPVVTCALNVAPGTSIAAMESCNLHGLWVAETVAP
jgi:superoxide reductase